MFRPAVHHNPKKKATVSFWYRGEFKRITLDAKDRQDAMRHVKAYYSGAKQISIVFFVKYEGPINESP
jgi:hypothetical protein